MTVIQSSVVFLFFLINFLMLFMLLYRKLDGARSSFIRAFLYFSVFAWALTEILSLFKILYFLAILIGWIFYTAVLLLCFLVLWKKRKIQIYEFKPVSFFCWETAVLGTILIVTFFIALAYPPNNWDSMTYHLPRIEHWLQNRSLDHYYTSIDRQLKSAPLAEMLILQGRALSGDDYLVNLVQWFSFLGTIIAVSKITAHLGMSKKMQLAAALFFATVPMAILQASSTQTDLVEAFFISCLAERLFAWKKSGTLILSLEFGIALGLAILTKGTAYSIGFVFVFLFTVISIKHFKKLFPKALLAALVCLIINLPHYTRNYMEFGEPLGIHHGTVSNFSPNSFVINFFANINSNVVLPLREKERARIESVMKKVFNKWNVNEKIFPYSYPTIAGRHELFMFHEDIARNMPHVLLLIAGFIVLLRKKNRFALLVFGSWCMFALFIPWQPWITRLQLPLFALSAPVFALFLDEFRKFSKLRNILLAVIAVYAFFPLFMNMSRPLIPIKGLTYNSIWNTSREKLNNRTDLYESYKNACNVVCKSGINNLGLYIGGDDWEYPLWRLIRKNADRTITITHVKPGTKTDAVFLTTGQPSLFSGNTEDDDKKLPLLIKLAREQ